MIKATGTIKVFKRNVQIFIDQELVNYYYSLIPKYFNALRPGHPAHITAIREFEDFETSKIEKLNNKLVSFYYGLPINLISRHFIIDVQSNDIKAMRNNIGLNDYRIGFTSYHFTVGYLDENFNK